MKRFLLFACAAAVACAAWARPSKSQRHAPRTDRRPIRIGGTLEVKGDTIAANRQTGELCASGHVTAVSAPFTFHSDCVRKTADGLYDLGENASLTTCTNEEHELHWKLTGHFSYQEDKAFYVRNATLRFMDVPVLWVPFWYYPVNTDYGFRFLPGFRSRWGLYFLSGYVYDIIGEGKSEKSSIGGSTYFDYRTKNGIAAGQTVRWKLGDAGYGKFKVYNAWDRDYDRYERHWSDARYNYRNWGSDVSRRRYRLTLEHNADFTERDSLRLRAQYLSDSRFLYDFFDRDNRTESTPVNEAWFEHRENDFAVGVSVSGPVNDFYGGTARLPEGWFEIEPQPVFDLPANYESATRAGYLNRDYARYASKDPMFRYNPYIGVTGRGADYQAFRADSSHRITVPFKMWDVLSVVPRAGYRGTYWSDSGSEESAYLSASGKGLYRNIAEAGFTASARATGDLNDRWRHVFEPYLDYSFQKCEITGGRGRRGYIFDNFDASVDWLDQFGFEGRGLPYDWHGVRPGIRNVFRERDDDGIYRTVLDADLYAAVSFEDETYRKDGALKGYAMKRETGNYASRGCAVPGLRLRSEPARDIAITARAEYDCDSRKAAYSDVLFTHRLADPFYYYIGYIGRDHRIWDYLPSEYDRWNEELSGVVALGFTHDVCDWLAWSPYVRYDCRRNELEEVGSWFDLMTECLGFRFSAAYETSYRRVDGSKRDSDVRCGFFVYLRAFGPSAMLDFGRF